VSSEYIYITTNSEAEKAVDYLMNFNRLAYDTETTGLDIVGGAKLLLMQIGTEETTYLFDPRKMDAQILKPVLESRDILKILHNAKFDYQSTKHETGIVLRNVFDTMLAYRLIPSGLIVDGNGGFVPAGFRDKNRKQFPYKSLNFLTQRFLGITLDKTVRETFVNHSYHREYTPEQLEYAAQDIVVLHPLCDILAGRLAEENLIETALLEFAFVRPAAEMELAGVHINRDRWREIIAQAVSKAQGLSDQMAEILAPLQEQNTLFGASTVNIKSQEQLLDAFRKLGFEIESTDKKFLKGVDHELARLLLDYRAYDKLTSTYGEAILRKINRVTERLHFTLHQLGADTGRLSSENPNIQNIPNDKDDPDAEVALSFRDCFVAGEGNVVLTADYSQCVAQDELVSTQWGFIPIQHFQSSVPKIVDIYDRTKILASSAHQVPSFTHAGLEESDFCLNKGKKSTVTVKTTEGFEIVCTPDHLLKVVDDYGRESWKAAGDLTCQDYLVLARDWVIQQQNPAIGINPEKALFLGYFIGDGSFSGGGIQIAKGEAKYADVFDKLNTICVRNFGGRKLQNCPNATSWHLIGKELHRVLEYAGISRSWTAHTKEVPRSVLEGGRPIISQFLRGLFEADGWVVDNSSNHVVAWSSRSEVLSRQVQLLLLSLGIFSKRAGYEETTSIKGRTYTGVQWRVSLCDSFNLKMFYERVGFLSDEKSSILRSLVENSHRSQSDFVILTRQEKEALSRVAQEQCRSADFRRKYFSNYFNTDKEFIRHYNRHKLHTLCNALVIDAPKEHLCFSKVREIVQSRTLDVYDISVPAQNMFVAGGIFVHNCELRILAEVSQDQKFLEIFRTGGDLHIITSQQVFGYSDEELDTYLKVKKEDGPDVNLLEMFTPEEVATYKMVSDYRSKTKTINFGIAYGLSAWSLADRFKISQEEAEGILDDYFSTYHGIKRWLDNNGRETIAVRHAKTVLGRKKYFTLADPSDEKMFRRSKGATRRMGNNHVIQGTNADITKEALIQLQEAYDNIPGAKILFTVHDEIVSECPKEVADQVAEVKAEVMKEAFHRFIKTVPVGKDDEVSVTVSSHWSK